MKKPRIGHNVANKPRARHGERARDMAQTRPLFLWRNSPFCPLTRTAFAPVRPGRSLSFFSVYATPGRAGASVRWLTSSRWEGGRLWDSWVFRFERGVGADSSSVLFLKSNPTFAKMAPSMDGGANLSRNGGANLSRNGWRRRWIRVRHSWMEGRIFREMRPGSRTLKPSDECGPGDARVGAFSA